ncbi:MULTISPECIES: hypothetical protein [Ensifer]|uniref:hypothetical protein n=1 Tax=Ensifer TaxID=106591 RepID=UPI000A4D723C|nr:MULTISPECIES: hypothetical protein [Ensifer]
MKFDTSMKTGTFVTFPGGAPPDKADQPADLGQVIFADGKSLRLQMPGQAWSILTPACF